MSIPGQHISLELDNLPLPFLAPSFVAQHFTEAENKRAESCHQFWLSLERDVNTWLIMFFLSRSLHLWWPSLIAISRQQHVPWSPRGRRGRDSAAPKLAACSGRISPSAPLFHRELSDLVCPECFLGAAQAGVLTGRFKTPAGKTLYSTETSVPTWHHPCSRDASAACWNVESLYFVVADFLIVEFTALQNPFHLIFLAIFY